MTIIALVPVIMAVVGALVYLVAGHRGHQKVSEIGRCVMFAGLLALALLASKTVMRIGAVEPAPSVVAEWAALADAPSHLRSSASS